ncbi:right-handed parallel beta-helix repeat-containing protein [Halomarina rubra]|uniref:Right-handed parallel beta-helix repeat-containing protein n=1 Tax=Halomarina rubra TaxID=2071873 RepID=A0ABD6B0S5_9EURY|nr:right-handed parallel beta-helix repeat-containing protein [Halomarina rubra]
MTSKQYLAVAFAVLTVLSGAVAGVAVTGTAAAAPQDVSSCTVIDEAGEYRLTNDITNESAQTCIEIAAENATLDGNGYTIDGVNGDGQGVYLTGGAEVSDVTVTSFERGATVVDDPVVRDSTFVNNTVGIEIPSNFDGVVENSVIARNGEGITTSNADAGTIRNTRIVENDDDGIEAGIYGGIGIEDSLVADNGGTGYSLADGYVESENTTYRNNGGNGISVGLGGVYSTGDTIVDNAGNGISTSGIVELDGTTVENNGDDGVYTRQGTYARDGLDITDSVIRGNDGDGVDAGLEGTPSGIHGSVIADNGGLGVKVVTADTSAVPRKPTVNATGNYWGSSDGPSSETTEPLEDPYTGALANGSGDAVSENATQEGVSNVHFDSYLTENPFTSDDGGSSEFMIEVTDYDETVTVGETYTVNATVSNVGAAGTETLEAGFDTDGDSQVDVGTERDLTLGYEGVEDVSFELSTDDLEPGNYTLVVSGDQNDDPRPVTVVAADDEQNDDEQNDSDEETDGDDSEDSDESDDSESDDGTDDSESSTSAYQIDVAAGDVIETLGDDEEDFYGTQGRLLQAQTVLADGTVTGTYMVPNEEVTKSLAGCEVSYTPVSYDGDTGEVTLSVSVDGDADCEGVTLTLAGYELPGDDTTFVRANADGQELVDYQTVTLGAGESGTVTIDLTDESGDN